MELRVQFIGSTALITMILHLRIATRRIQEILLLVAQLQVNAESIKAIVILLRSVCLDWNAG